MTDPYIPPSTTERQELEGQITLISAILTSLDATQPQYTEYRTHYEGMLHNLYARLSQCNLGLGPSLLAPSPGESSVSGSRKRSLDLSDSGNVTPYDTPGDTPGTPMSIERFTRSVEHNVSGPMLSNYIDLTGLDNDEVLYSNNGNDPFPELVDAFQPSRHQPADAFDQDWMGRDELAQFLLVPSPAGSAYVYNQDQNQNLVQVAVPQTVYPTFSAPSIANRNLEELAGDDYLPASVASPEAVQDLIENIRGHDDLPREPTPKAMSSMLMEHQKIALTWLLRMERGKSKGGILADEMGLGKTVEALSLILAHPSTDPACKTTLIVAPIALMRQWEKEIERHVKPRHRLTVYIYHGHGKKVDFDRLRKYDVVLTTFGTLSSELKQKEVRKEAEAAQREQQDSRYVRPAGEALALLGRKSMWYRVILDEAQCIKNRNTLVSKAAHDLQAQHRLCMTGTPMMNGIDELFPLLRFLKIPPYHEWSKFSDDISKPLKRNNDRINKRVMNRVQALLKSIMLRRGKTTIIDGKQICEIPPKHTNLQSVEFSDSEHELYKAIETHSQVKFNRYLKKGTVNNNYANVLVMLLRLRQVCCHPKLIKDLGVQVSTEGIAEDELLERAKLLREDVVDRLKATEAFECPICYETDTNPTIIIPCGHATCGECFQKLIDPSRAIREGIENASAKCPNCRGALTTDKITDYQHFCKVFCPERLEEYKHDLPNGLQSESEVDSGSDDSWDSLDDDDDDNGSLKDFVVSDSNIEMDDDADEAVQTAFEPTVSNEGAQNARKGKGKGKPTTKPAVTLAQLKKESLRNKDAKRRYLKRLRKTFHSSAKLDKTVELISDIRAADPTEKTLVFSQWTGLLDLLEVPLAERKFKYKRYDGSMRMNDRAEAVNQFMDDTEENIMLISLKAGNAGLNLSKASQVIILDPFWNPFIEEQAIDRAHRMPQNREVHVHRILVPETVEDRICALQDKKREIINTALDEGSGKRLTRLSIGELQFLFGLRDRF